MTYPDLDRRLIEALQKEGRKSLRGLAADLDVSTSTVRKHLDALLEEGVITGFKPVVDYGKLGFGLVAVTRIKARGDALAGIIQELVSDARLTHVYEITGDFDIMAVGRFENETEMNREIKRLLRLPGIEATNTSIVLSSPKEGGDPPLT